MGSSVPLGRVRVVACLRPLSMQRIERDMLPGCTLAEIVERLHADPMLTLRIEVNGAPVAADTWATKVAHCGDLVTVRAIPSHGDAGRDAKNALNAVATIGAVAAAMYFAPLSTAFLTLGISWVPYVGAATAIAAAAMANKLFPHAESEEIEEEGRQYSLAHSRNAINPGGVVPTVYGRYRFFPPYASKPYTEMRGEDQWVHMLFAVGHGPLEVSNLKFGEHTLAELGIPDTDVEIRNGYDDDADRTLFIDRVDEVEIGEIIEEPVGDTMGAWVVAESAAPTTEIAVQLVWPQGLIAWTSGGKRCKGSQYFDFFISKYEEDYWLDMGRKRVVESTGTLLRKEYRWRVADIPYLANSGTKKYKVRVRRVRDTEWYAVTGGHETIGQNGTKQFDVYLDRVRSYIDADPIGDGAPANLCTVAVRAKASDKLQGQLDQFNLIAESVLPVYTGAAWTTPKTSQASPAATTRNPAWVFADILRGGSNLRPLSDSLINADEIKTWADACDAAGIEFNALIDKQETVHNLLKTVAAVGRATPGMRDDKFAPIRDYDRTGTDPVQCFTPRNSWGFSATKAFLDRPHALKAQFKWEGADETLYTDAELVVCDDGYGYEAGETEPTKFDSVSLWGVTDATQAYRAGRYLIGVSRLRPEIYTLSADFENLICQAGDLVKVVHDVPMFGSGSGRVKEVLTGTVERGLDFTGVRLDDSFQQESGKHYSMIVRKADNTWLTIPIDTWGTGEYQTVRFEDSIADDEPAPEVGDLCMVGERTQEAVELLVAAIEPGPDLSAKLTLVDHAPGVFSEGDIPPFDPHITAPPVILPLAPPQPQIQEIQTDETVMVRLPDGSVICQAVLSLIYPAGRHAPVDRVEVQHRIHSGADETCVWRSLAPYLGAPASVAAYPVETGGIYDFRVRSVSETNVASEWSEVEAVTIIGASNPPPDVTMISIENGALRWAYPDPPIDLWGFLVRMHQGSTPSWETATALTDHPVTATSFAIEPYGSGERTFMVKAIDIASNESANAASITVTVDTSDVENSGTVQDWSANAWEWVTIEGGTVNGSNQVVANGSGGDSGAFWGTDGEQFWGADGDPFWPASSAVYSDMTLTTEVRFIHYYAGPQVQYMHCVVDVTGGSYRIEYGFADDFDDEVANWLPFPGYVQLKKHDYLVFRLIVGGGPTQGVVRSFKTYATYPAVSETVLSHAITNASSPERVTLTKKYTLIQSVIPQIRTGNGIGCVIDDKDAENGPRIYIKDAAGNNTTGTLDVFVKGY